MTFIRYTSVFCWLSTPGFYLISAFLRAKIVEVTLALNMTRFLRNERAYLPWEATVRNLRYFVLMFDRSEVNGPMQASVIKHAVQLVIFKTKMDFYYFIITDLM